MGQDAYSTLALVWTISTFFGLGVATPTEQVVTRRTSAGSAGAARALLWLALFAAACALLVLGLGNRLPSAGNGPGFLPGAVVAIVGWALASCARGLLAGRGLLGRYALLLWVEGLTRVCLVAAAFSSASTPELFLAGSVGIPVLLSGALGLLLAARHPSISPASARLTPPSEGDWSHAGEHVYFGVVSVAYQACLNGPTLLLDWKVGGAHPAIVGAFVALVTLLRAPTLLVGGLSTHALVQLSRHWAFRDLEAFSRDTRVLAVRWARLVLPSAAVLLVAAPWVAPLYYGAPIDLPFAVAMCAAVSTVIATAGAVGTGPLFAAGRGSVAAGAWLVGATSSLMAALLAGAGLLALCLALVVGPTVAAVVVVLEARRVASVTERTGLSFG